MTLTITFRQVGAAIPDDARKQLQLIEFAPLPGLESVEVGASRESIHFAVRLLVPDRTSREPKSIVSTSHVPLGDVAGADVSAFARILRAAIKDAYEHEIDESILVGGKPVFDPHRRDG